MRLVHFADYRYSADLDFTTIDGSEANALQSLLPVVEAARMHAGFSHLEVDFGAAPRITYLGPLDSKKVRFIKVDVTGNEEVEDTMYGSVQNTIWDDLPDTEPFEVYALNEIAAEKLRCVIQREQCRDLYDLFQLATRTDISFSEVRPIFERKMRAKSIALETFTGRYDSRLLKYKGSWATEIREYVNEVPHFDEVTRQMRKRLKAAGILN